MLIVLSVVIFALLLAFKLPFFYERAKISAIQSQAATTKEGKTARPQPFLAVVLVCGGVLPAWLMTHNPFFTMFVLLLGSGAYIDCVTQWVPDVLIFALSWGALCAMLPAALNAQQVLMGAAVMLIPVLALNLVAMLRAQPLALASGDLYVLPAIGAWLTPGSSALCLATSLALAMLSGRYVRGVPFITVLYPVFVGVSLCAVR